MRAFAFAAMLALGLMVAGLAQAERLNSALDEKLRKCESDFKTAFSESYKVHESWKDISAKCALNRPNGVSVAKNNIKFTISKTSLTETEKQISKNRVAVPDLEHGANDGICERAYNGASWALESLQKQRLHICTETLQSVNTMYDCFEDSKIKKCEQDLTKIKQVIKDDGVFTNALLKDFAEYLKETNKNVTGAKNYYDKDRQSLMTRNAMGIQQNIAENGRAPDNDHYLSLLVKNPQNRNLATMGASPALRHIEDYGDIVVEQIHASEAIGTLIKDMAAYKAKQDAFNSEFLGSVGKFIAPDTSTNISQYAGLAAPAASALSGVGGAAGAANAALPLAAAAAGAASMATSVGKSSVGGDYSGASAAGPGAAAATTETSTTPSSGSARVDGGQILVNPTAPITEIIAKNDKADARAPASDTFIPGKVGGSGSSTSNGKETPAAPAQKGVTNGGASGGGEDLLHSFNDAIKPIPAPTKKKDDGLAGMNDLFGSMTKMFNFDAAPTPAGDSAPPAAATASANGEFNDGFQYGGGGAYVGSGSASSDQATSGEENASPEAGEMMQFGSIGTPLFQRVHSRHRIAMEKGWLVQEFGKLPQ